MLTIYIDQMKLAADQVTIDVIEFIGTPNEAHYSEFLFVFVEGVIVNRTKVLCQ